MEGAFKAQSDFIAALPPRVSSQSHLGSSDQVVCSPPQAQELKINRDVGMQRSILKGQPSVAFYETVEGTFLNALVVRVRPLRLRWRTLWLLERLAVFA